MKWRNLIWVCVACLSVMSAIAVSSGSAERVALNHYTFEGELTPEQQGSYLVFPFQVPEGTTIVKVLFSYSADKGRKPYLEIGIHDPFRFRGWTTGRRGEFTVSASRDHTTDGNLAGEIPAGEWRIEIGACSIKPDSLVSYRVEIDLSDEPVGATYVRPPHKEVTLKNEARWYYGDLHCHTTHSDGSQTLDFTLDYAHQRGLDFIAVTEHNTTSHFTYLNEMQDRYDDMLIIRGIELTSYVGHANVFGYDDMVDFRATAPGYDINRVIDEIHAGGGYFSPNHPEDFADIGIPYLIEDTDWSRVDFFEVVNGKTRLFGSMPNPINQRALEHWDRMLQDGYRMTAIGGSDDHWSGQVKTPITTGIGMPATVVYAEELSEKGILRAIKAGHVYVMNQGKSKMAIEFTADGNGRSAMMGDRIEADEIVFHVRVDNAALKRLIIVENGQSQTVPITGNRFEYSFIVEPKSEGYARLEVKTGQFHEIITNPIFYGPGN